jgi:hypothetical protein
MKIQQDMDRETFGLAMDHEKQWRKEIQDTLDVRNKAVVDGFKQVQKAQTDLSDFFAKSALSDTDYQILKIHEVADEQKAAFKGTEEQRAIFDANIEALANESAGRLIKKRRTSLTPRCKRRSMRSTR